MNPITKELPTESVITSLAACGYIQDPEDKYTFVKKTELPNFQDDNKLQFVVSYVSRFTQFTWIESLSLSIYFHVPSLNNSAVLIDNYAYQSLGDFASNHKEAETYLLQCYQLSTGVLYENLNRYPCLWCGL